MDHYVRHGRLSILSIVSRLSTNGANQTTGGSRVSPKSEEGKSPFLAYASPKGIKVVL